MADIKTPEERSRNMMKIKSRDTKPELWLRGQLFRAGYRYRKNVNTIPGHPDLWLARYNTAIFVHGCFWHRHPGCKYAYTPKSRIEFWEDKFRKNIERDRFVQQQLEAERIRMAVIWECTIERASKGEAERLALIGRIINFLESAEMRLEL